MARDSWVVARYLVDPDRSTVTVVPRPRLTDASGPLPASVTGEVHICDAGTVSGSLRITLDATASPSEAEATIDLAGTTVELKPAPNGEHLLLHGRAIRSAGTFGLAGSPLLNPRLELRWRLVLMPVDETPTAATATTRIDEPSRPGAGHLGAADATGRG